MTVKLRLNAGMLTVASLATFLAACAQPVSQNFDPPPARRVDAKTSLETGRR